MGGELSFFHLHISHYAPYLPNKFCIAFHFSWVLQLSQEKLKTMLMQNYGGRGGGGGVQIRCIMGDVQVAYWEKYPQCPHSGEYRQRSSQRKLAKLKLRLSSPV